MIDPNHPDPYLDDIPHNPGELCPSRKRSRKHPTGPKARCRQKSSPTAEARLRSGVACLAGNAAPPVTQSLRKEARVS